MTSAFVTASAVIDWQSMLSFKGLPTETIDGLLAKPLFSKSRMGQRVIGLKDFVATVEEAGKVKNCCGLSWSTGLASNYTKRGKVGQAIRNSKTVGVAFKRLVQYYPLIQDRTDLSLDIGANWTTLGYKILDPDIWPRNEDALYTLGLFASFVKTAAPEAWGSIEILVEADKSLIKSELDNIVKANVIYGADKNGIRFPTTLLRKTLNAKPSIDNQFLAELNHRLMEKIQNMPMSDRTRQMIFRGLPQGNVDQNYIAKELGVSRRTLRRKLAAENLSFQAILDECRMRVAALEFRICPHQSLSEMALKLGYSEHSTFSRAFLRWAGMAPQEFRKHL